MIKDVAALYPWRIYVCVIEVIILKLYLFRCILQLIYGQLEFEVIVPDSKSLLLIAPSAVRSRNRFSMQNTFRLSRMLLREN
mgnify:CR=1 FL=1